MRQRVHVTGFLVFGGQLPPLVITSSNAEGHIGCRTAPTQRASYPVLSSSSMVTDKVGAVERIMGPMSRCGEWAACVGHYSLLN